jgi:hypothetical protein
MNIRQLRDTRQLKTWLRAGRLSIRWRGTRVIGHIIPEQKAADAVVWPDFEARRKKVFGDRILPGDLVIEERGRY